MSRQYNLYNSNDLIVLCVLYNYRNDFLLMITGQNLDCLLRLALFIFIATVDVYAIVNISC